MPIPRPFIGGALPAITPLTDDVLIYIFSMNADMTDDGFWESNRDQLRRKALNVTRHTSQVSRYWRTLILGYPTIWAGLIDLQLFRSGLDRWREEVFRRCSNCLLSVKGLWDLKRDTPIPAFKDKGVLIDFFDTYWDRIINLHVRIMAAELVDDETWLRILCRPARFLRTFNLELNHNDDADHELFPSSHNLDATLFSNIAPALHRFHQDPTISLSALRSPWWSQLRILELKWLFRGPRVTATQVLDLLDGLHLLEILNISPGHLSLSSGTDKRLRPVELPQLLRLGITCTTLEEGVYFLGHITPRQGCSLSLDTSCNNFFGHHDSKCVDEIVLLAKHFELYAKGLNWYNAHTLALTFTGSAFRFTTNDISWGDRSNFFEYSPANFHLELKFGSWFCSSAPEGGAFLPFLLSVPFSLFGTLKVFDLRFLRGNCLFSGAPRPEFQDLLISLHSVETLITYETTLSILVQWYKKSQGLLALLRTLEMQEILELEDSPKDPEITFETTIMDFLRWRMEGGREIETLDLRFASGAYTHDLGFLEEITGLKVMWEDEHEYVCGTGTPEELDLRRFAAMKDFEMMLELDPSILDFEDESPEDESPENELNDEDSEWW